MDASIIHGPFENNGDIVWYLPVIALGSVRSFNPYRLVCQNGAPGFKATGQPFLNHAQFAELVLSLPVGTMQVYESAREAADAVRFTCTPPSTTTEPSPTDVPVSATVPTGPTKNIDWRIAFAIALAIALLAYITYQKLK